MNETTIAAYFGRQLDPESPEYQEIDRAIMQPQPPSDATARFDKPSPVLGKVPSHRIAEWREEQARAQGRKARRMTARFGHEGQGLSLLADLL